MNNLNYEIKIIKNFCKDKFEKTNTTDDFSFFHKLLSQNLEIYTNKQDNTFKKDTFWIYKIFDIQILCIKKEYQTSYIPSTYCSFYKPTTNYKAIYTNQNMSNDDISEALRGSSTLKINEDNCYDNDDIKVVFYEKGFLFQNKYDKSQKSKFEAIVGLFILSLAYREKIEHFLEQTSNAIDNNHKEIINIKKDIYTFNLKYFFNNPIHYNHQQKYTIWSILFKYYKISEKHQEVKTQIENLVDLLYTEQKEKQEMETIAKEEKRKKIEFIFIILGFIITLASLISTYKDLGELLK